MPNLKTSKAVFDPAREQEILSESNTKVKLARFWQIFFDFQFFLFCCPFRIKIKSDPLSPTKRNCVATSFLPQKLLCGILTFVNIFWIIHWVRLKFPPKKDNPSDYLVLVAQINTSILRVALFKVYWFGKENVVKIVNFIVDDESSIPVPLSKSILLNTLGKVIFFVWCALVGILGVAYVYLRVVSDYKSDFTLGPAILFKTREIFFLGNATIAASPNEPLSTAEIIISILTAISDIHQEMFYTFLILGATVPILSLWSVVTAFTDQITVDTDDTIEELNELISDKISVIKDMGKVVDQWPLVQKQYEAVKKLSTLINNTFGLTFACVIAQLILYYSTLVNHYHFLNWANSLNYLTFSNLLVDLCTMFAAVLLAGSICSQVRTYSYLIANLYNLWGKI